MNTRSQINESLIALGERLSEIMSEHGPEYALERFSDEARVLTERVQQEDAAYVYHRISCMLSGAGLIPGQDEGEQCRIGD